MTLAISKLSNLAISIYRKTFSLSLFPSPSRLGPPPRRLLLSLPLPHLPSLPPLPPLPPPPLPPLPPLRLPLPLRFLPQRSLLGLRHLHLHLPLPRSAPPLPLQPLLHFLLTSLNRPNHSPDCISRPLAAESLRQLEQSFPLLLSDLLFSLAQSERTHASQSYLLLLAQVLSNVVAYNLIASPVHILSNSAPLVPFAVRRCLL